MDGIVVVLLIVGIGCALAAAWVAADRRVSSFGYFVFGLLFGPIGLLAACLARPVLPKPPAGWSRELCLRCGQEQNAKLDEAHTYNCWRCNQLVKSSAVAKV